MNIEIKKSIKPVKYDVAIKLMEERLLDINNNKKSELIWILEHEEIYTAGSNYKKEEILNKDIKLIKTKRGGKITYHGPGQLICYFVIDLKKRKKDIRKFITIIEKTIIESLSEFNINHLVIPKILVFGLMKSPILRKWQQLVCVLANGLHIMDLQLTLTMILQNIKISFPVEFQIKA